MEISMPIISFGSPIPVTSHKAFIYFFLLCIKLSQDANKKNSITNCDNGDELNVVRLWCE